MVSFLRSTASKFTVLAVVFLGSGAAPIHAMEPELEDTEIGNDAPLDTICKDKPNWRYNDKERKTCEWIWKNPDKRARLCEKKRVKTNCPETCGVDCNDLINRNGPTDPMPPLEQTPPRDPCKNDPSWRWNDKERKSCDWISRKPQNKERLCVKRRVREACPETCGVVCEDVSRNVPTDPIPPPSSPITKCPKFLGAKVDSAVPAFDRIPSAESYFEEPTMDCSEYLDGLTCYTDYRYNGCSDDTMQCTPSKASVCSNNVWQTSVAVNPALCGSDFGEMPYLSVFGEYCDPKECPVSQPKNGSDCSSYEGEFSCMYNYKTFGCDGFDDSHGCFPTTSLKCTDDNKWQMSIFSIARCPDGSPQGQVACDPEECPLKEPMHGTDCSSYEGKDECHYDYKTIGCDADSLTCAPTKYYTCMEEPDGKSDRWQLQYTMRPACYYEGADKSCDPSGCPLSAPIPGTDCSSYNGGKQDCMYNFKFDGCSFDDLRCSPTSYFSCNSDFNTWEVAETKPLDCEVIIQDFEGISEDLPVGETCKLCPTVEPADLCPAKQPRAGTSCTSDKYDYEVGLVCSYDFKYEGCSTNKLKCKPHEFFECTEQDGWVVKMTEPEPCN